MEKVGFGRTRVYPKFEMSGSGMSGIRGVGFGRVRVLNFRVRAGISGIEKSNFFSVLVQLLLEQFKNGTLLKFMIICTYKNSVWCFDLAYL